MLEQEIQDQENAAPNDAPTAPPAPTAVVSPDKELFNHYEIKNWNFSPRIYKILAGSAIFNVLLLAVVGQTHLLTQKGCDSPLVSKVCQVIDIVYIGGKMLGTDTAYVDKDYDKTQLGDDIEITYLDVGKNSPPLNYPEGYFALANPEEFALRQQMLEQNAMPGSDPGLPGFNLPPTGPISTFPSNGSGADLLNIKPNLPPSNGNVIIGNVPDSPFGGSPAPRYHTPRYAPPRNPAGSRPPRRNPSPFNPMSNEAKSVPGGETASKPKPTPSPEPAKKDPTIPGSDPVAAVVINVAPLKDVLKDVIKNKVNLESEFEIRGRGKLNDAGEFESFKYLKTAGQNKEIVDIVKQSITAISQSGYLQYLVLLSGKSLELSLQQNNEHLVGEVTSELENAGRAISIKTLLDIKINEIKAKKEKPEADDNDKDDLELLKNATVTTDGRKLVITFTVPKQTAQDMIKRRLLEQDKQTTQPNSTAVVKDQNVGAGK